MINLNDRQCRQAPRNGNLGNFLAITKKIAQFSILRRFGPVYLKIPWIGKPSTNLKKEVKKTMESCCGSVRTSFVFTSKQMLPVALKDVLPTTQKNFEIYEYKCHCNSWYTAQTSQQLLHQATCSTMVETTIALSTPISTTKIMQTKRPYTKL